MSSLSPKGWAVLIAGLAILPLAANGPASVPDTASQADSLPVDSFPILNTPYVETEAPEQPWSLAVEQITVTGGGVDDTLELIVETPGFELAGAVLKLGISSRFLRILEILPGEIIDSCRWEMFQPSETALPESDRELGQLWQVIALARRSPSGPGPICYQFDRPASLARLVISSGHLPWVPDTTASIFFYWESCRDNVLSDKTGSFLAISKQVIDRHGDSLNIGSAIFPTRLGSPDNCVSPTARNAPHRLIEFRNGGVEFRLKSFPDTDKPNE